MQLVRWYAKLGRTSTLCHPERKRAISKNRSLQSRDLVFVRASISNYFFSRLVWLATHCHLPWSITQVSVNRPT
jgi:hypothetical protein